MGHLIKVSKIELVGEFAEGEAEEIHRFRDQLLRLSLDRGGIDVGLTGHEALRLLAAESSRVITLTRLNGRYAIEVEGITDTNSPPVMYRGDNVTLPALLGLTGQPSPSDSGVKVRPAPGHHVLTALEFFFSERALERVIRPALEDMRSEYFDALMEGRRAKAAFVRARGTWALLKAAGLLKALSLVKSVVKFWTAI